MSRFIYVTFGRLAVSDFELGINVIVLLIYCDVRFCTLVHFGCCFLLYVFDVLVGFEMFRSGLACCA